MKTRKLLLIAIILSGGLTFSCSKDESATKTKIYYVIEGQYNYNPNVPAQYQNTGFPEVHVSLSMPGGSRSEGNIVTPHKTLERDYDKGMTIVAEGESILSYTTITIKIYKDGGLWKEKSAASTGMGNYAYVKISEVLQ